jgi:hypothetical protein
MGVRRLLPRPPVLVTRGTRAKNAAAYAEIWQKLADSLGEDTRFQSIDWRSREEGPPEPDEIGDAGRREEIAAKPPEPLDPSQAEPGPDAGFRGFLFLAAIFGCLIGIAATIAGVIRVIVRGPAAGAEGIAVSVGVFSLSALVLWALYREPKRKPTT